MSGLFDNTMNLDKIALAHARLGGIKVIENNNLPRVPKIQISSDFEWCTDEVRAKINQRLLELFGSNETAYMMSIPDFFGKASEKVMVMSAKQIAALKL